MYELWNGTAVRFRPVPEPGGYTWFPGNNPDRTIQSGSKPRPQPGNLKPLLTLVWFNLRYVGLQQPPIHASIADLDTSANTRNLGAWRIPLIHRTSRIITDNNEQGSGIYICTTDMSSARQQQLNFPSDTLGCSGRLWRLWLNLIPSDGELHAARRQRVGSKITGLILRPSGTPRSTWEQSGKIIYFGNAAGAPGNHSYYLSLNDFQNLCIQCVFSSVYLCIYIAIWLHTV